MNPSRGSKWARGLLAGLMVSGMAAFALWTVMPVSEAGAIPHEMWDSDFPEFEGRPVMSMGESMVIDGTPSRFGYFTTPSTPAAVGEHFRGAWAGGGQLAIEASQTEGEARVSSLDGRNGVMRTALAMRRGGRTWVFLSEHESGASQPTGEIADGFPVPEEALLTQRIASREARRASATLTFVLPGRLDEGVERLRNGARTAGWVERAGTLERNGTAARWEASRNGINGVALVRADPGLTDHLGEPALVVQWLAREGGE